MGYIQGHSLGSSLPSTVASSIGSLSATSDDDFLASRCRDFEGPLSNEFQSQEEFEQILNQFPMPEGWQKAQTDKAEVYFINHIEKKTYWEDPRISNICKYIWIYKVRDRFKTHS